MQIWNEPCYCFRRQTVSAVALFVRAVVGCLLACGAGKTFKNTLKIWLFTLHHHPKATKKFHFSNDKIWRKTLIVFSQRPSVIIIIIIWKWRTGLNAMTTRCRPWNDIIISHLHNDQTLPHQTPAALFLSGKASMPNFICILCWFTFCFRSFSASWFNDVFFSFWQKVSERLCPMRFDLYAHLIKRTFGLYTV